MQIIKLVLLFYVKKVTVMEPRQAVVPGVWAARVGCLAGRHGALGFGNFPDPRAMGLAAQGHPLGSVS